MATPRRPVPFILVGSNVPEAQDGNLFQACCRSIRCLRYVAMQVPIAVPKMQKFPERRPQSQNANPSGQDAPGQKPVFLFVVSQ